MRCTSWFSRTHVDGAPTDRSAAFELSIALRSFAASQVASSRSKLKAGGARRCARTGRAAPASGPTPRPRTSGRARTGRRWPATRDTRRGARRGPSGGGFGASRGRGRRSRAGRRGRAGRVLRQAVRDVDAEAVDAAVEPEPQDRLELRADLRVRPVEVRLLGREQVEVPLAVRRPAPRPARRTPTASRWAAAHRSGHGPSGTGSALAPGCPGLTRAPRGTTRAGRRCGSGRGR